MEAVTTLIRPAEELCSRTIRLSAIDQIAPRDYNVVHLFFRLPGKASKLRIFQELEIALVNTASEIPEVVCVVRKCKNDREEVELVYNPSSGAELSFQDYACSSNEHQWPHGTFDDLAREHFPMSKLERRLLLGPLKPLDDGQVPGLVLRANFIQGGLILSTSLHHIVCDGLGVSMFHQILAKHMTALVAPSSSASVNPDTLSLDASKVIIQERTVVVSPDQGVRLDEFPHWKLVNSMAASSPPEAKVKYSIYFISGEKAASLRERISKGGGARVSTLDALAAFIWTHVVRARRIDTDKYPEAKLSITVDARGRMTHPAVPARYWGNFCEPNAVACLPTKFLSGQFSGADAFEKPSTGETDWLLKLPRAAQRVRQAIAAVDNVAVRRLVGLLNQMPKATSLTWNVDRWPGPDMLIVCTEKFSFNRNEWGRLGYSEATRITIGNTEEKPDGRCLLLPPRLGDGKGVEVALQYDVDTLDRSKESKDFAEFFTWRN